MEVTTTSMTMPTRSGKSAQAVGQMAKTAVAEAKAAGVELPKNAQGMAASAIARGADPSSVFAALVTTDSGVDDGATGVDAVGVGDEVSAPVDDATTEAPAGPADATTAAAEEGYAAAVHASGVSIAQDGSEIALALLNDAA